MFGVSGETNPIKAHGEGKFILFFLFLFLYFLGVFKYFSESVQYFIFQDISLPSVSGPLYQPLDIIDADALAPDTATILTTIINNWAPYYLKPPPGDTRGWIPLI